MAVIPQRSIDSLLRIGSLLLCSLMLSPLIGQDLNYPKTRKADQVDDYHGIKVADPYRWLEDDNSVETAAWVKAENQVTFDYLEKIPYRPQLKQRLQELYNYPKYGIPSRSGAYYLWSKNDGLQNQSVLYVQKGLEGTPRVLIDPNQLSPDGTVRLMNGEPSREWTLLCLLPFQRRLGLARGPRSGNGNRKSS
jgi:prolyl oligopeptidase